MNIEQKIKTYEYEDGEIQRVQCVKLPSWDSLEFFETEFSVDAFNGVIDVIDKFQVQKYPMLFGTMIFFHIPKGLSVPFAGLSSKYGNVSSENVKASILFKERFKRGKFIGKTDEERQFVEQLKEAGTYRVLRGYRSKVSPMPFSEHFGRMSFVEEEAPVKVNSNFFIMDSFDCATVYDSVGTPIGLCVKNGKVINPPLYEREALIVTDSGISVEMPRLADCTFNISGIQFVPGINCTVLERPVLRTTKRFDGTDLVIVGTQVLAVKEGGKVDIPGGGFVLRTDIDCSKIEPGAAVSISGFEDVKFAIQVANSIVKKGVPSRQFISKFYNIYKLSKVAYPPCFYPLDYEKSRAARIAIGADKSGAPYILWAEGAAKIGHEKGKDSRGASLADMEIFCRDFKLFNAINLDGGGSSQILLENKRSLLLSDRKYDGLESERGIPLGLIIKS